LRNKYRRAKRNTINFFNYSIGEQIETISIADDDRIIKINCVNTELYFTIRGKYTNVVHFDKKHNVEFFKTTEADYNNKLKLEFECKRFITSFNSTDFKLIKNKDDLQAIKKKYPILGIQIIKEAIARSSSTKENDYVEILRKILTEIKDESPVVFIDEGEINLGFESFISFPYSNKEIFNEVISAQNYYLSKEIFLTRKDKKLKLIQKNLDRDLAKLANKINNLRSVIEIGSKEDQYNKFGNLLLMNKHLLKIGMDKVTVKDIYHNNKEMSIKLNPNLKPQKSIDYYFDKSKAEKINLEKSKELLKRATNDYERLKLIEEKLTNIESIKELDEIMKELKIKKHNQKKEKEDLKDKFKQYVIDDKYNVFVGKDSKNNDLLTTKFAKQNDLWFHARSVSGSHVVLRVDNTKEAVPKNILKKVAALAAYHSKAKTAGTVPVAFTFKKYVVKKKGDPVGTVHLLREDVLLVKPEIPKGCEFVKED
jgi:predicted ribosome quality control (RQC) complex YloA/Tae2 family protein